MKNFANQIREARRILVANPGGLGDDIHLLPSLDVIRQNSPGVVIDILASDGAGTLLSSVEGVAQVFPVSWSPRFKDKAHKRRMRWEAMKTLWSNDYDAFIDFRPSDQTQLSGLMARAPARLGVRCMYWSMRRPWVYTHTVNNDWVNEASYEFLLKGLDSAGFDTRRASLGPHLLPASLQPLAGYEGCIHVSLCTSADCRELPAMVSRELISELCRKYPERRIVVTCMGTARETAVVQQALSGLGFANLEIAAGKFSSLEMLQLLMSAALHIGPDTGTVHMAWLCGTPSVSWYLNHESLTAWMPRGELHTVLVSPYEQSRLSTCLKGVSADQLLSAVQWRLSRERTAADLHGLAKVIFVTPEVAPQTPYALGVNRWADSTPGLGEGLDKTVHMAG